MTLQTDIETIIGLKLNKLDKKLTIIECGVDSLKLAEIIGLIERKLNIELDYEDMFSFTIEDLIKLINKKI